MSSQVIARAEDLRIRSLRGPKPSVDPWTAHGSLIEEERRPNGAVERALTIFLAGAECAFTCAFCDLWRYTIDGATPAGALPKQIAYTLTPLDVTHIERVKLYNASNFFDPRAVPLDDVPRIAELCAPFAGVTVETHARTIGPKTLAFARQVRGRLEVAMGLETIHDASVARLSKRLDLESGSIARPGSSPITVSTCASSSSSAHLAFRPTTRSNGPCGAPTTRVNVAQLSSRSFRYAEATARWSDSRVSDNSLRPHCDNSNPRWMAALNGVAW